jgi:signal transduction histidine kinase
VLVVDDNEVDRERIRRLLGEGFLVTEAATAAEGIRAAGGDPLLDCILIDYRLPDQDGIDLLHQLAARDLPVLMMTSQGSEAIAVESMRQGAWDYLPKPALERELLRRSIARAIEGAGLHKQVARQRAHLEEVNRALSQREAQLRLLMTQLPGLVWTTDMALRITSIAGTALRAHALDPEPLVGREVTELMGSGIVPLPLGDAPGAHRRALTGAGAKYEVQIGNRTYECQVEPLRSEAGATLGVIGVAIDVTEGRSLEQQLRQAQKMDAVGKLAGGVAHDFNNLLMAILAFADFAQESIPPTAPAHDDIDQVIRAAQRAKSLVAQLMTFSRQRPVAPRAVILNDVVLLAAPMLRRLLGEDVELTLDLAPTLASAFVDPGGLEQVIVNLAINARDAMPDGGRLVLQTRDLEIDDTLATAQDRPPALASGRYVVLSVSDDGAGIPREIQDRIFEPFFTTKDVGRGTGLGLSTCYGIIRDASGTLSVESEVGQGSTFRVHLPACSSSATPSMSPTVVPQRRGAETILVVEDEATVRAVVVRMLQRLGYHVLSAGGAGEAMEVCDAWTGSLDLLLSDVVMPLENGPDVAVLVKERHPRARILFMSGHADRSIRIRDLVGDGTPLIEKPFSAAALGDKVREVLDGPCPPPLGTSGQG